MCMCRKMIFSRCASKTPHFFLSRPDGFWLSYLVKQAHFYETMQDCQWGIKFKRRLCRRNCLRNQSIGRNHYVSFFSCTNTQRTITPEQLDSLFGHTEFVSCSIAFRCAHSKYVLSSKLSNRRWITLILGCRYFLPQRKLNVFAWHRSRLTFKQSEFIDVSTSVWRDGRANLRWNGNVCEKVCMESQAYFWRSAKLPWGWWSCCRSQAASHQTLHSINPYLDTSFCRGPAAPDRPPP